jgi:hypothetical protein
MVGHKKSVSVLIQALLLLLLMISSIQVQAQDLEPRRWSHLPTNLNVIGLGTGWTNGDMFLDPLLLAEDVTFDLYLGAAVYVRTFEFLGKTARVDLTVPYASGRWEGYLDGEHASVRRRGFADPFMRFSINLYGAPPLSGKEYVQYRREHPVTTTVGAALSVRLPLGDYNDQWLINLGSNRFVVRPQLGVLHQHHKWQFELTGSVFLYQTNDEFWKGTTRKQDPLWFTQGHVIYTFKPGWWASFSGGYAYGGENKVNGLDKDDAKRSRYIALSFGVPINARQGLKFTYFTSDTHTSSGTNIDALLTAWTINWGGN